MKKRKLPTEEEIINRIEADWSKPKVTFLSTTYNQQDYIADTIEGFLIQKTSFPYEIIIHDDCSTDKTRKVIDSYKAKYPNLIRTIYQKQNQYSQGVPVTLIAAKEARAEYIALCEGDDYWINENKIEKQLTLMLDDPSITMVISPGKMQLKDKFIEKLLGQYGCKSRTVTAQEVLNVPGQFAPTSSYILKKDALIKSKQLFASAPVGDLFIELYCATNGKLVYFPEVGSVYRLMAKNSWSSTMAKRGNILKNKINYIESLQKTIRMSRNIDGFEMLDWSIKISELYYTLSVLSIRDKKYVLFRKSIEASYHKHNNLNKVQTLLYSFRNFEPMILCLHMILKIRSSIKSRLDR